MGLTLRDRPSACGCEVVNQVVYAIDMVPGAFVAHRLLGLGAAEVHSVGHHLSGQRKTAPIVAGAVGGSRCSGLPDLGVHIVHTFAVGLRRIGAGSGRIPCVSGCCVTGSLLLEPVLGAGERSIMDFVMPVRVSNRKHFTTDQKHAILDEYEKCLEWGSKAAFIRAAGITEGTMNHWCRQRESGELRSRSDTLREDQRLNAGDKQLLKRVLKENEILKAKLAREFCLGGC